MLKTGPALRIVIHLNDDTGSRSDYLHSEVLTFLLANEVAGATVLRPHAGFGLHHHLHTRGASGSQGDHLPIRVEFIETREKVEQLLPQLLELVTDGVVEAQETTVLKVAMSSPDHADGTGERE